MRLASDVVATTTGRVQQHAAMVIMETARCASGPPVMDSSVTSSDGGHGEPVCSQLDTGSEPGCTSAELAEVSVLLDGLLSSSVALREVSVQVSMSTYIVYIFIVFIIVLSIIHSSSSYWSIVCQKLNYHAACFFYKSAKVAYYDYVLYTV